MKISVLVPCHNEEKSIVKCIESLLNQTRKPDQILVVNDASTDKSLDLLQQFGPQIEIISLSQNTGNKSYVQEIGLKYITGDVFIATDADTVLDPKFVSLAEKAFEDPKISAFAGYVKSLRHNWLTACREIDYVIGQTIHKVAQSEISAMFVIPGCAGAFRTNIFKRYISFDHDTLTEDLDFTYKLHLNDLKIAYNPEALVYTQDPSTLKSYINQVRRWNCGGWQNLLKHKSLAKRPQNALEMFITYAEGLIFSFMLFLIPAFNMHYFLSLLLPYIFVVFWFTLYAAIVDKRRDLVLYFPAYFLLMYINSFVFIEQFFKEVILKQRNLVWYQPERRSLA